MAKTAANARPRPRGSGAEGAAGREYQTRRMEAKRAALERQHRRAGDKKDEAVAEASAVRRYQRSVRLSHDTAEKREESKLRLHISKTRRKLDALRERLRAWDDVEERRKRERAESERKRRAEEEAAAAEANGAKKKKKKRGRLGPETWKLRGAARPAWEVYDFDTRYVDPHIKAHEEAREKAKRIRNVLSLFKGRFGEERDGGGDGDGDGPPQPHCREFLSLLMQLGHLCVEAKKFKSAREAFLECMELEGTGPDSTVVTTARARLMRMYMEANRPESARRLWERLPHDGSAWIRYSAALIEYVSWNLLEEDGSSCEGAEAILRQAIEGNVFCAYYIAFHDTFEKVMEYGDEIEDADPGTLEEAIEYCHSEQMGSWLGTDGAVEWIRGVILRSLNEQLDNSWEESARSNLESWEQELGKLEDAYEERRGDSTGLDGGSENGENKFDEEPDILMYTGMFRTAMDMLQDAGEFLKVVDDEEGSRELSKNA